MSEPRRPSRRVVSAPLASPSLAHESLPSKKEVETLFYHPMVKIVSFVAYEDDQRLLNNHDTETEYGEVSGTLAWSSRLERTIAVGPFRIYRAPGSVAFLNCGAALQPIFPKSRCWCVDEADSKFVLQIRRPTYWRIELPTINFEDRARTSELRAALEQLSQFEKTSCPFQRPFTVELPDQPRVPLQKKPWRPIISPLNHSYCQLPSTAPGPASGFKRRATASRAQLDRVCVSDSTTLVDNMGTSVPSSSTIPYDVRSTQVEDTVMDGIASSTRNFSPEGDALQHFDNESVAMGGSLRKRAVTRLSLPFDVETTEYLPPDSNVDILQINVDAVAALTEFGGNSHPGEHFRVKSSSDFHPQKISSENANSRSSTFTATRTVLENESGQRCTTCQYAQPHTIDSDCNGSARHPKLSLAEESRASTAITPLDIIRKARDLLVYIPQRLFILTTKLVILFGKRGILWLLWQSHSDEVMLVQQECSHDGSWSDWSEWSDNSDGIPLAGNE